ncbi:MAG TPA: M36 family metallopeptidase [Candidatus Methanoperedens sp.]|nr:M36 family metallopeptidase [Candidatus Methanoperedens sp.]
MRKLTGRLALAACLAAATAAPAPARAGEPPPGAPAATALIPGSSILLRSYGRVFKPNPVNTLNNKTLKDNADADSAAFTPAYRKGELLGLKYNPVTAQYFLRGPWVNVTDAKESPFLFPATNGVISSKTGSFPFGRTPDQFEHVMAYYHIDTNQRYIQGLGVLNANQRQILVDPHGGSTRYVANPVGKGYLVFGTAGVDDAEDADVILHEYAHAIQDNQAPGKYLGATGEAAAMGEGFADYWAASSTYDQSVASGFPAACIGEWNRAPGCMDRVDGTKKYADKVGTAQADGQIWSAALWDLFQATGDRGATDTIVLQSHFLVKDLPGSPTFKDGVEALLAADAALYPADPHQAQICSVMAARGIPTDKCGLKVTVTWDDPLVDIDLHLRPPEGAGLLDRDYSFDCYSAEGHQHPDWGVVGDVSDDPLLRSDCRYTLNPGCHEEQIVLMKPAAGSYKVYVHYYDHDSWEDRPTTATVQISKDGVALFSGSQTLTTTIYNDPETSDLWLAFTVEVAP